MIDPTIALVLGVFYIVHMVGSLCWYRSALLGKAAPLFELSPGELEQRELRYSAFQRRLSNLNIVYDSHCARRSDWWGPTALWEDFLYMVEEAALRLAVWATRPGVKRYPPPPCPKCGAKYGERCDAGLHS